MEVGFFPKTEVIPNFEQVSSPNRQKVQKLSQTDPSFLLKEGSPTSEVNTEAKFDRVKDKTNVKPAENFGAFTEVKLYNSDFGYNESSKDFFIKVSRGTFVDNKYPTDDIMRLKSFINNTNNDNNVI